MATIDQTYFLQDIDPVEVYEAYMSSSKHSAFTGSDCKLSKKIGGACTMFDGYILATNLELEPGKLIVQSWVAIEDEWPEGYVSIIKIALTSKENGTLITFTHSDVPEALNDSLAKAWYEYYWEPLGEVYVTKKAREEKELAETVTSKELVASFPSSIQPQRGWFFLT